MRKQQQGLGMIGMMIVVIVLGTLGITLVKLLPIYIDNWTLRSVVSQVVEDKSGTTTSPAQVRSALAKQFKTNRIDTIKLSEIEIKSQGGLIVLDVSYEKRVSIMFNVDAVVKFEELLYEIPRG